LSEVALPLDRVDSAALRRPQRWNVKYIRDFMLVFGTLSSLFDLLTFALLLLVLKAGEAEFQTAWFVESMATQVLVVFVIRTRGAAWRSRPARWLIASALGTVGAALLLPYTPFGAWFGFVPLPLWYLAAVAALTATYLATVEVAKHRFHRLRPLNRRRARGPRLGPRRAEPQGVRRQHAKHRASSSLAQD
jgi:P-type Mg2+ transporter